MEEKKLKPKAGVKDNKTAQENTKGKMSYEELNNVCMQLYQQNQNLMKQLQQANMGNTFKRMDYLFKVIELEDKIKNPDFVNNCIAELVEALTPEEDIPGNDIPSEDKEV